MNVKIIQSKPINIASLELNNRYDLLFDDRWICNISYENEPSMEELIYRFEDYVIRNVDIVRSNKRVTINIPKVFEPKVIFNKEMPELELTIKRLLMEKKLKDIEEDFV